MTRVSDQRARWLAENVLKHEPALRAWLSRRPIEGLEIDDLVQEAYAAIVALPSVDHIRNPRNYLFQAAHSQVLTYLRRARVVRIDAVGDIERFETPVEEPSPERRTSDRQELRRIAELIAGLPSKCREAFTLRKVEGLSQRDTARRMGVSENTIEKHMAKAVRQLMDGLGRGGNSMDGASRDQTGVRRADG